MRFERVRLAAGADRVAALHRFYADELGLACAAGAAGLDMRVGETAVEFEGAAGQPFYHFAFLVPGDRFEPALRWAGERVSLLTQPDSDSVVFDFEAWDAQACYFHDPAGSIVELIAHRGIGNNGRGAAFDPGELLGLSELGLVGDMATMANALCDKLGLEVWDGTVTGSLAFVGEQARTLILARAGRGWLPTGRPSEPHPAQIAVSGGARTVVELEDGRYRVTGV